MNYDFGPKRNWRRWTWNRIAERARRPRTGLAIYLPGEEDFDAALAVDRGFRDGNLIGVERDAAVRRTLRAKGRLVVAGDFASTVWAASRRADIDVVYGDFCRGLSREIINDLVRWFLNPRFDETVFAFNFLRGRELDRTLDDVLDRSVQTLDERVAKEDDLDEICDMVGYNAVGTGAHRGVALVWTAIFGMCGFVPPEKQTPLAKILFAKARICSTSYRSTAGRQRFDSVVFSNPLRGIQRDASGFDQQRAIAVSDRPEISRAARSLAAALAHRTRRAA